MPPSTILDRLDAVDALDLPVAKKATLRALVRHTDNAGRAFPHVDRLAAKAGVNPGTARRHLDALEAEGWLTRDRTRRPWDGRFAGYRYVVNLGRLLAGSASAALPAGDELDADTVDDLAMPTVDEWQAQDPAPARRERGGPARRERGQEGVTTEGDPFPCADRRAPAAPPGAGEGKATKQQPPEPGPLDALALALPDPLRRALAAPDQTGGRRALADLVDELLAAGWHLDDAVAALADGLPPDPTPGVLIDRARRYLADGPPLDLDAIAAEEAAGARARHLAAAAGHGRTRAALELAADAPPLDDVDDDAARQYPHDLEARAVFVDAYRVALAEAVGAEPAPARPPAAAPVDVDDARARIARIRSAARRSAAA